MENPRDIIRKPVVTEKSTALLEENKYTFIVDPRANKIEIRNAVEELFNVKVDEVRTMRVKGKFKRVRNRWGKTPEVKKAIVTLKPGSKIQLFEGM
ncbi:MAG: 50S ribosomal protein L23 [Desulfotomaculum sp. BICA1-6]|nr:MAG: 50S ribosomal protein L23 [Peptococcaceae bacterium BRH_c8a]KJS71409.1 MAG: 50S ribosomal protein L23 [Desulfotomaculum sp. BICA1-6]